jgi:hypothetical protein
LKDVLVGAKSLFPYRVVAFKDIMLYGMEGLLTLLYITVFVCLDMTPTMPMVADRCCNRQIHRVAVQEGVCDVRSLIRWRRSPLLSTKSSLTSLLT